MGFDLSPSASNKAQTLLLSDLRMRLSLSMRTSKRKIEMGLERQRTWFLTLVVISALFVPLVPVSSASLEVDVASTRSINSNNSPLPKWKTNLREAFGSGTDVKSPLHVAQCRATCLQKFNNREDEGVKSLVSASASAASPCFQLPDCFTCWKSCELLESGWNGKSSKIVGMNSKPICSQPRICLSGCQAACNFYEILTRQSSEISDDPVIATKNEYVLHFSDGKIQWPKIPKEADVVKLNLDSLVYLVIQQYSDSKWRQIAQTSMREVDIPRELNSQQSNKLRSTRVLVVSPSGLVTMYSPQLLPKDMNDVRQNQKEPIAKSSIVESEFESTTTTMTLNQLNQPFLTQSQTQVPLDDSIQSSTSSSHPDQKYEWNLRKVSLIHQKFLVIAELTWNPFPGVKDYLITWELDGGGLKGHLVTDSTVVTLSLWPDTVYHIQVELCGEEEEEEDSTSLERKSFPLAVDTSEALFPMVQPSALSKTQSSHKSVTEFLNVTLLVTVSSFLFILLCLGLGTFTWCRISRRRSRGLRLLQDMEESDTDPISTTKEIKSPSPGLTVAVISNHLIYSSNSNNNNTDNSFLRLQPPLWSSLPFAIATHQQHHRVDNPT